MKNHTHKLIGIVCLTMSVLIAETRPAAAQTWTAKTSAPGTSKDFDAPFYFTLNNTIYAGGGLYGKTLLRYNATANQWTPKKAVPGTTYGRTSAMAFSINGKAYLMMGTDFNPSTFDISYKKDVLEYDTTADSWTAKASFPSTGRADAAYFVVNGKAYIIGGYDTLGKKDEVWEYSQANNQWTQKKAFPFGKVTSASGFSIGSNGYVVGGNVGPSPGSYSNKLYKYDAATDTWTQKADYPGDARSSGTAFVLGNKAYYGLGASTASGTAYNLYTNFYAYDTATNKWGAEINGFPASGRLDLASGVINNKAYVGLGWKYVSGATTYYTDWYELKVAGVGVSPITSKTGIVAYPNPSKGQFHINSGSLPLAGLSYRICSIAGALVKEGYMPADGNVDLQNAQAGTYVLTLSSEDGMQQRTLLQIRN